MSDNKVKLGDGLADGVKSQVNQETLSICNLLLERFFEFISKRHPSPHIARYLHPW